MGFEDVREEDLRAVMESLRQESGAFVAAPSKDYRACWLRDHLYIAFSYWYLGDYEALARGMHVAFDILHGERMKLERITPPANPWEYIHAKYNAETLGELTKDWGHHQLDAVGLFLHTVADLDFKHICVIRNEADVQLLQLLVFYLFVVRYWEQPDFGMWEEGPAVVRSSSVGAVTHGLSYIQRQHLAVVPDELILAGRFAFTRLLPEELPGRFCDMAQLSLIWPYNIVSAQVRDEILRRIDTTLVQEHGLNRYWGDNYYRSKNGVSAEWPMGFFWRSIVASQMNDVEAAERWLCRGFSQMTKYGKIPELYWNGKLNDHTPLAWAHAMALIALRKFNDKKRLFEQPGDSHLTETS